MDNYQLIDSGDQKKLEQVGKYRLVRPCSQAVWKPLLSQKEWDRADLVFTRKEKGEWQQKTKVPDHWNISIDDLLLRVQLTEFGHLGVFFEHQKIWKWMRKKMQGKKEVKVLNLFAYSGGATLALAKEGAQVCHLDASRPVVEWAKENAALNHLEKKPIRWIVDDVSKFLKRESKRNNTYDAIILDPPTFGRGTKNEIFKIDDQIQDLLQMCRELLVKKPLFVILSCHTPGYTGQVLKNLLMQFMPEGKVTGDELMIESKSSYALPSGHYAIWEG